ncbi:MAG: dihydropteroate synthase [Candidatus Thermoplasmatota archaeon]
MFETRVLSDLSQEKIRGLLSSIGCDERGIEIMTPKADHLLLYAKGLDSRAANIVKQEFLSAGGETAVAWKTLELTDEKSEILMMGTRSQYERVREKLKGQPFDLPELAEEIKRSIESYGEAKNDLWEKKGCQVMGVLNVTPDSFFDGGKYDGVKKAVQHGIEMEEEGADIIDIGGESTRPGSERISIEEELERVLPVIEELSSKIDIPISIDTYKPEVAEEAVDAGAEMVNDVFGLRQEGMPEKVAQLDVPVVIMHMQGKPKDMQEDPTYEDVIGEISSFLLERIETAKKAGVSEENIIIDPGIGFGKKLEHNLEIINRLDEFTSFGYPVLLGASRKSFLGEVLGKEEERLYGSLALASSAVEIGVSILRVHDVSETADVVKTVEALDRESG